MDQHPEADADGRIHITVERWEDGEYVVQRLDGVDRWAVHASDVVHVAAGGVHIAVHQRVKELRAEEMSVGAVTWDGAFVMLAHLASMATGALRGRHVLELGAGPGLPSLFAAKTGARCTVTDLEKVLPLIEQNIAANGLRGAAEAAPLQWGAPGDRAAAAALATPAPDFLLACDTCYLDPGDEGGLGLPSVQDFVGVCRACMGCNTTFLLAFEPRASAVREELLVCLRRTFATCREVPSSAWREALPCEHVEMFEMRL